MLHCAGITVVIMFVVIVVWALRVIKSWIKRGQFVNMLSYGASISFVFKTSLALLPLVFCCRCHCCCKCVRKLTRWLLLFLCCYCCCYVCIHIFASVFLALTFYGFINADHNFCIRCVILVVVVMCVIVVVLALRVIKSWRNICIVVMSLLF